MDLVLESYLEREDRLPQSGRHILAQYDDERIVVYQAYRPSIGQAAVADQRFGGGGWSFERMSWIKTSFLWMMYRCGWGTKPGQEVVLAVHLRRVAFDEILRQAVQSSFVPEVHGTRETWKRALEESNVRLQWDPDYSPDGQPLERRAIQLGLRRIALASYAHDWILRIEDISEIVRAQRQHLVAPTDKTVRRYERSMTPTERVYPIRDPELARCLGLSTRETP